MSSDIDEYTARRQADADAEAERVMIEEAYAKGVAEERERWKAALRCNGTCPPCRDPKSCKREAVGLHAYVPGG